MPVSDVSVFFSDLKTQEIEEKKNSHAAGSLMSGLTEPWAQNIAGWLLCGLWCVVCGVKEGAGYAAHNIDEDVWLEDPVTGIRA